jgi:type III secretion protein U
MPGSEGFLSMADDKDSGDKTELPTAKRLRDARNKGDILKSKDISLGLITLVWLLLVMFSASYIGGRITEFAQQAVALSTNPDFDTILGRLIWDFTILMVQICLLIFVPVALLATLAEFIQAGPVATAEKMKPSFDKMNPVEGLKRMFGMEGLVEMVKSLVKVALILVIMYFMVRYAFQTAIGFVGMTEISAQAGGGAQVAVEASVITHRLTVQFFAMVAGVFLLVGVADYFYSRHKFIKKMMMSMRDIKQEHKSDEGDPHIRAHRREMHQQWANENAIGATGGSMALLVNPTHLAIALDYDEKDCPVPVIAAKGQGELAAAMRKAAEDKGVPIIRNIGAARKLWARGEVGEIIPEDMFDAIAEIILWAKKARAGEAPAWQDFESVSGTETQHHRTDQLALG